MSDPTLQTLTGALASIAAAESSQNIAPQPIDRQQMHPDLQQPAPQQPPSVSTSTPGEADTPAKRRPGRPKGSGKKPLDPNAEPKVKRPVGRPRKDGLPAGSVGPKRPGRPRKRPPGTFASGPGPATPGMFYGPYGEQWPASISAPPMSVLPTRPPAPVAFPIDPSLDRDNWADLSRNRPDIFLHTLVSALSAPNPISAAGPSVEEAFKAHLVSLASNGKNTGTSSAIPTLYSILKTFWLPSSPMYFSLTASASATRTPSEHRFLYWDPQPLVFNGIGCPACNSPLTNRGRIASGPIKVYDLGKPFFVIGCEYACESAICIPPNNGGEGRKFASTDASILRALPSGLRGEFPARLLEGTGATLDLGSSSEVWGWRGMGVSIPLWNMVRACLRVGLRKDAILSIIRGIIDGVPEEVPPWPFAPAPPVPVAGLERKEEGEPSGEQQEDEEDADGDGGEEEEEEVDANLQPGEKDKGADFQHPWQPNNVAHEPNIAANPNEANGHHPQPHPHPHPQHPPPPPPPPIPSHPVGPPPEFTHTFPQQPAYIPYPYPQPPFGYYPPPSATPVPPMKRTFALMDGSHDPGLSEPQKRVRHCVKCGSHECKGKGGRGFCPNRCQDCGKMECKGRNSKRPDRTCEDAWP